MNYSPYSDTWWNYDAQGNVHDSWSSDVSGGMVLDLASGTIGQLAPSNVRVAQRNVLQAVAPGTTISWKDAMAATGQVKAAYRNVAVDLRSMVEEAPGQFSNTGVDFGQSLQQQQQLRQQLEQQIQQQQQQWTRLHPQWPWQQ